MYVPVKFINSVGILNIGMWGKRTKKMKQRPSN